MPPFGSRSALKLHQAVDCYARNTIRIVGRHQVWLCEAREGTACKFSPKWECHQRPSPPSSRGSFPSLLRDRTIYSVPYRMNSKWDSASRAKRDPPTTSSSSRPFSFSRVAFAFHTVDREVPRSVSDAINSSARGEAGVQRWREIRRWMQGTTVLELGRKSRECKVPGRTYRESVRILRSVCLRGYGYVYTGKIVAEFLNGTRFVGTGEREGE